MFKEADMCFIICVEFLENYGMHLSTYLYPRLWVRKIECMAALEQVLGISREDFDRDSIEKEYEDIML